MAFVLIQHLSPEHGSMLAELLGKVTPMPVLEASDGVQIAANTVYVIPPNATMTIDEGKLKVARPAPPRDRRHPIDTFFLSLAEDQGENAVSIILSGTGSDGALGLSAVKEHGGFTLAQAEFDSHALPGMPRSAAETGDVDEILAVEEMPARLVTYEKHLVAVADTKDGDGTRQDAAEHLSEILTALRKRTGHDFSGYKEKTLTRRVQRRMQVLQVETPAAYVKRVQDHPEELDVLFGELLIRVTHFFRDPAAFEALSTVVLRPLVAARGADADIRVWVPGCATGEEAYSIAILLREAMNGRRARPKVQIFGTDIDERAIAIARQGRYQKPLTGLSPEQSERWFSEEGADRCVISEIREMCVFSTHSVVKHPPFSKLDLVSCRNLFIYLDSDIQDRLMRTFHYALRPGGTLFLGMSESVTRATKLFGIRDKKHRIFERREVVGTVLPTFSTSGGASETASAAGASANDSRIDKSVKRVMEKYYPPHVVVDRRHQVVRFSGAGMGKYLEPPSGAPSAALFDILRKPLRIAARSILQDARIAAAPVRFENCPIRIDGRDRLVTVIAEPLGIQDGDAEFTVLAFQDLGNDGASKADKEGNSSDTAKTLEEELQTVRMQLQSSIDELETTNEELKSSNEEYQSVNEELQSSNEELETAKEEMQSVNEELQTINSEMASKNDQLSSLNSDIKNLLESTEIATLFLDDNCRIRSFTRGVTEIFHVREADIGRPITEIVSLLSYETLRADVSVVLNKLTVVERQLSLRDERMAFTLRIRPYRTVDNVIDGVVMTFVDITQRQASSAALKRTEAYLRLLIDSVADGIYCVDREGRTTLCNTAFLRMLGFEHYQDVINMDLHEIMYPRRSDGSPYLRSQNPIYQTALTGEPMHRDDDVFFRVDGTSFPVEYWVRPILRGDALEGAVCTFIDTSARRQAEQQRGLLLREMDHRIRNLFTVASSLTASTARSAKTPAEMRETLQGRFVALAKAHRLIQPGHLETRQDHEGLTLGGLVRTVLSPYMDAKGEEQSGISIEGPEVPIGDGSVTNLALLFHELATNAAKYGALSSPNGQLRVRWKMKDDRLELTWQETGGPALGASGIREGFGSLLARQSVKGLNGELDFDWSSEGLTAHLSIPRERLNVNGLS
jgi:two-component system CheB/CheR fusion protein